MFNSTSTDASDVWNNCTTTGDTNWVSVDAVGTSNIDEWSSNSGTFTGSLDFRINVDWLNPPRIKTFEKEFML